MLGVGKTKRRRKEKETLVINQLLINYKVNEFTLNNQDIGCVDYFRACEAQKSLKLKKELCNPNKYKCALKTNPSWHYD